MLTGGCHCGAIRYETADEAIHLLLELEDLLDCGIGRAHFIGLFGLFV